MAACAIIGSAVCYVIVGLSFHVHVFAWVNFYNLDAAYDEGGYLFYPAPDLTRPWFVSVPALLFNAIACIAVATGGIVALQAMHKQLMQVFWMVSTACGCCCCCEASLACCGVVSLSMRVGLMSAVAYQCDLSAACRGVSEERVSEEQVLDCAAASLWHSEYTREYPDYGAPDLSGECSAPQVWMLCENWTTADGRMLTLLGDGRLQQPATPSRGRGLGQPAARLGGPAQRGPAGSSPADRRLTMQGVRTVPVVGSAIGELRTPMPDDVMEECKLSGGINAIPTAKEFLTDVWPAAKILFFLFAVVICALPAAFCAGAFFGKSLYDNMPVAGFGNLGGAPMYAQPEYGAQAQLPVQGSVVQGSVVQDRSAQGQYVQGQYGQGQ